MHNLKTATVAIILHVFVPFAAVAAEMECPLDYPQAVIKNGSFKLDKEKRIAVEHMRINNHVELEVETGACEYVTTTYRFIITDAPAKYKIVGAEYQKAIELLTVLEKQPTLTLDFTEAKKTLQNYLNLVANPKLQEELYMKDQGDLQFSEKIWIDADVESNPAKVEVTLSSGPY